jgi:hypothetical protein
VVGKRHEAYFRKMLAAPHRLGKDSPKKAIRPEVIEVDARWIITDASAKSARSLATP